MSSVGDLSARVGIMPGARAQAPALARPWALALALAIPLAGAYLIWAPPAADLSAAIYRSDLFARVGYALRDNGWYAAHGHYLLGYSLLSPALGALVGVRLLMAVSVLVSCALFGLIAERAFGTAAGRAAALVFALGACAELLSGRVPYDLGMAIGLGSVLALMRGRAAAALALALLTSAASPVAGAFLALVCLAWGLALYRPVGDRSTRPGPAGGQSTQPRPAGDRSTRPGPAGGQSTQPRPPGDRSTRPGPAGGRWTWPAALALAALAPIAALALAFPEGGYEPFAPSSFWPAWAAVLAIALLLPAGPLGPRAHRGARIGLALYALALAGSFAIASPVGGNAARLGPELVPALLAGVLWQRRRLALCAIAPALLYWQFNTPLGDLSLVAGQASAHASYYDPVLAELQRLRAERGRSGAERGGRGAGSAGAPTIVEVPLTAVHAEAAYLAGHDGVELARGWERQLDTRYAALFYRPALTAAAYRAWLHQNRVRYVALPDARLDYAGRAEGALVARGLPYLREVWRSAHWRLYRVIG